jgi:hypothetical protein
VLTGPAAIADPPPDVILLPRPTSLGDMVRVRIADHRLTATAVLAWNGDLPRALQQILFDTAAGLAAWVTAVTARPRGEYGTGRGAYTCGGGLSRHSRG